MNVFHRFTRASLRQNPSRTLVTIIGIVLSMALVTAVIQGAYSGVQFLVRSETARVGAFHGYYYDLTEDEAAAVAGQAFMKKTAIWQTAGWAEIDSENEYKPYLLIRSVSDSFTDLVTVHLTSGRMPENSTELLLPDHLATNGGVFYKTGDTPTLKVGRRTSGGYELTEANPYAESGEELTDTVERTYTVVGTYERFDNLLEDYGCPGYTALTGWDGQATGARSVFFTVKNVSHFYDDMANNAVSENWRPHDDLLRFTGTVRSENLSTFIYGFAGVLIFLIAFGSISLIYNSFAISVSERTRQFGILKSVGATKKQIRRSVLYEALLQGGIGILGGAAVGCLGIGITLWALRDAFAMFSMDTGVQMKLVVSPLGLVIAAAVCLITTLISAWIPAQRANRVSAIDAIRQTGDVKVRGKDVKVSGLTKKLFGFEGMMASKNFKRNRKRYRATIVSLFLSVTLFIAASSFCAYLTDAVGTATAGDSRADIYYTVGDGLEDPDQVLSLLTGVSGVERGCYLQTKGAQPFVPADAVSNEYVTQIMEASLDRKENKKPIDIYVQMAFVDDDAFRALCNDNGLNADDYYDAAAPKALLYNRDTRRNYYEDGSSKWVDVKVVDENKLPIEIYTLKEREFKGYTIMEHEEGNYYYFPDEYVEELNQRWNDGEDAEIDRSRAMVKTEKEVEERTYLTVAATVKETLFALPDGTTALIYPYEMRQAVLGDDVEKLYETSFVLIAPDHARAFEAMKKELSAKGMNTGSLFDRAADKESQRMLVTVVRVFSYGFIILISLIAMANVFNTVSTNVMLRRREFAMLRSIGLGERGFRKMMNYECIIYGCKGLLWGLPAAVALTYVIYRITGNIVERGFYIPWYSVAIAVGSVFAVVFATMLYATNAIRRDNPIDALRQENI